MREISLNILDIANNSIAAGAKKIEINVIYSENILEVEITDDGKGMSQELVNKVQDPFVTTRKTRSVGLGIPFFKQSALATGQRGGFELKSKEGEGTRIKAVYDTAHIDCMPMGDLASTFITLLQWDAKIRWVFTYVLNGQSFVFDTEETKEILGGVELDTPEVLGFLKEYFTQNIKTVNGGKEVL